MLQPPCLAAQKVWAPVSRRCFRLLSKLRRSRQTCGRKLPFIYGVELPDTMTFVLPRYCRSILGKFATDDHQQTFSDWKCFDGIYFLYLPLENQFSPDYGPRNECFRQGKRQFWQDWRETIKDGQIEVPASRWQRPIQFMRWKACQMGVMFIWKSN